MIRSVVGTTLVSACTDAREARELAQPELMVAV